MELIGPSAVCLPTRVQWASSPGIGYEVEAVELAQSLGIGHGGVRAPLWRTLSCLVRYGSVEWSEREVHVYNEIAPLTPRRLPRTSDSARATHDRPLAPSDPTA